MSDQAQGLRALADQARRDQNEPSPELSVALMDAPDEASVASASAETETPVQAPPLFTAGVALADARLRAAHTLESSLGLPDAPIEPVHRARVVAVTSGKGGVGKTSFTVNLALALARTGQRVVVFDADLGLANLHVLLGVKPRYNLAHVLRGEKSVRDALCSGPGGILLVGGGSGIAELANLSDERREEFIAGLSTLDALADVILIDTGAGLSRNVLAFLNAVEEIIVVTTPEPTALTDAYATIKVSKRDNPHSRLMLVVNMAASEAEAQEVAVRLANISKQFLQTEIEYAGCILSDPAVPRAVRAQKPFLLDAPHSPAARSVVRIAAQLGYQPTAQGSITGIGGFLNRIQQFWGSRAARS